MAVGLPELPELLPVKGIRLATASAGLYKRQRDDLALIVADPGVTMAAVFTRNAFCAAPVLIARTHLERDPICCLINAGNANAGTGSQGCEDALKVCRILAEKIGCKTEQVLPFSTGVIGEPFPVNKICDQLPALSANPAEDRWPDVARAIMTTDTLPKGISRTVSLGNNPVTITGVVKGAGMIRPDMATMLAFIATDAAIEKNLLQMLLAGIVESSFNRVSIDGDTSTNDACVLMATGKSDAPLLSEAGSTSEVKAFKHALTEVCQYLAQALVRDGEGVTKFVTLDIRNGRGQSECLAVAETIAHSPLVKTALFASDPNWGRILAAVGRAGIADLDVSRVAIYLDNVCIVQDGARAPGYTETQGSEIFAREEITIRIDLQRGTADLSFWTSDLSNEYVRINSEYRS